MCSGFNTIKIHVSALAFWPHIEHSIKYGSIFNCKVTFKGPQNLVRMTSYVQEKVWWIWFLVKDLSGKHHYPPPPPPPPQKKTKTKKNKTYIYILCHSSTLTWHRWLESFVVSDKDLPILHSQYNWWWWWPDDTRSRASAAMILT